MASAKVPEDFRSTSPAQLRDLASRGEFKSGSKDAELLLSAAAEIEGSEQAYSELVMKNRQLHQRITHLEANLKATIAQLTPSCVCADS